MHVIRLVPFLVFGVLLGGQVLISEEAYATCCACSYCKTMAGCSCPGTNGCTGYKCPSMYPEIFQAYIPMDSGTGNMKVARNVDVIDRFVELRQVGECARRSLAVRLLGDAAGDLKAEPAGFDSSILALQIAANDGRD